MTLLLYLSPGILTLSSTVTTLLKYCTMWKLRLNTHKTETILFSKRRPPPLPGPLQIHYIFVPWASAVRYLNLTLDSQFLYTRHFHTVANKATAVLSNIFPPPRPRFNAQKVQQVNHLQIVNSIHSKLYRSCLQFQMSLQLPQTPSHPVTVSPSHR